MASLYLLLSLFSLASVFVAIVPARRIGWGIVPWFLAAWLCGELAVWHLLWQIGFTALLAIAGVFESDTARFGLGVFALSWLGQLYLHWQAMDTPLVLRRALLEGMEPGFRDQIPHDRRALLADHIDSGSWLRPFRFGREGVMERRNLSYGDAGQRNLLDVYQPVTPREGGFPVLLQVHGGGWIIGKKEEQAKPLMYHMAERGWLCVAINYRLSPAAAFPAHIIDVKKAIAWIREHIAEYGGNPDFIAITGGSAGGHLSSLAALTPNRAEWQEGFEDIDTSIQAAVPFYGVYDFTDRNAIKQGDTGFEDMIGDKVMQCKRADNPELWDAASPIAHLNASAPPMFIVHGSHDSLVMVEEARAFFAQARAVCQQPVAYAELPGAQHAFEIFHSVRTDHTVNAVGLFLEWSHAQWLQQRTTSSD